MINKTIKPILFNTEDVKAILDGKKNKTTRVFSKTQLKYFDYAQKLCDMSSLDNLHENDFAYIFYNSHNTKLVMFFGLENQQRLKVHLLQLVKN